ncbi:MAG: diacylglycerol kinase family protein [Candidatus Sericytochromatia bacterium]
MMRAKNVFDSFKYAYQGIIYSLKTQRNMRIHVSVAFLVVLISIYLKVTKLELAILVLACNVVITAEMINTSIESTIDLYSRQRHPLAKIGKDVAAAAVLVSSITSAIIGLLILGPYLLDFLKKNNIF